MTRWMFLALILATGCGSDDKGTDSGGTDETTSGTGGTSTTGPSGGTGTIPGGTGTATGGTATGGTATGGTATGGTTTTEPTTSTTATGADADGDGFVSVADGGADCDDTRADINPSMPEICNPDDPVDDDCNGLSEEDDPGLDALSLLPWAEDGDGDGYGSSVDVVWACAAPPGTVEAYSDCDDTRADINPGMPEICNPDDPVDDNCNGRVDDADPDLSTDDAPAWYLDEDGDGVGVGAPTYACAPPVGHAPVDGDCDDTDPTIGAPSLWFPDGDGDGYPIEGADPDDPTPSCDPVEGYAPETRGWDCDDTRDDVNPGATEVCGEAGLDEDCNDLADDEDPGLDLESATDFSLDGDGDGFGASIGLVKACVAPVGYGVAFSDCDDDRADINPGMPEICNPDTPTDDDCDGLVDEDDPDLDEDSALMWYVDDDGDGFGTPGFAVEACAGPVGSASNDSDCDDSDPTVGPPALWFADDDGDTYGAGDPIADELTCESPVAGAAPDWRGFDCLPEDPAAYPGAPEICEDGIDQDCDGEDAACARLYAGESGGGTGIWEIDLDAGTAVSLFDPGVALTGLTFDDAGALYGITGGLTGAGDVYLIDIESESIALIASTGLNEATLAFAGGLLYAADQFTSYISIDPATGDFVVLGGDPGGAARGWGYANVWDGSEMYRMNEDDLRIVDAIGNDDVVTRVSGIPGSNGGGLAAWDGMLLYAAHNGGDSTIYVVDKVTGDSSELLSIPSRFIDSLAAPQ